MFFAPLSPRRALVLFLAAVLGACAGPSAQVKQTLTDHIADGNCPGAEAFLRKAKNADYGRANAVLYHLDLGMVLHECGRYRESNRQFSKAERLMRARDVKSVSQETAALLANENSKDYQAEGFERALSHLFHTLNYVFLGRTQDALVEVRRMEDFLDRLDRDSPGGRSYRDDAFGHYLSALLYEESGAPDDARISYHAAQEAYARYQKLYGDAMPDFEFPTNWDGGGEVVFLHYAGPAPRKISVSGCPAPAKARERETGPAASSSTGTASGAGGTLSYLNPAKALKAAYHGATAAAGLAVDAVAGTVGVVADVGGAVVGTIANETCPAYVQDPYAIRASSVSAGGIAGGVATELAEPVSKIAEQDLKERLAIVKARSMARGLLKLAAEAAASGAGSLDLSGTQFADVRGWSTIPAQIRLARLKLPPGTYDLAVDFQDDAGRTLSRRIFKGVVVAAGKRSWLDARTIR